MITLYVKPGCPYCLRTLAAADLLHVPYKEKDIYDRGIAEELIARGGKRQMPYMVDSDTGTEMYESEDIVTYLHQRFPREKVG